MVVARKWVAVAKFQGEPKRSDFQVVEEQLPALRDGEVLTQAEYISVDPYMRAYAASMQVPYDQFGYQVAKIIESKDPKHPVGTRVVSHAGWRDLTILKMSEPQLLNVGSHVLPDIGSLPTSHGIGAVGMPGMTAYFGFLEICQPKAGETVVVTGAAGAVGSLVGQIAKIKGCKVIGFVGSDKKVKILTEECGFDHAFNYKTADIGKVLKQAAPKGIDCYFDNVGGEISSIILSQMNTSGRVSVCGSISCYNEHAGSLPKASIIQPSMVFKQIKMEGFVVWKWDDRAEEAYKQMSAWLQSGKLVAKEHITEGFDNLYDALVGMMRGDNVGKAVVKV